MFGGQMTERELRHRKRARRRLIRKVKRNALWAVPVVLLAGVTAYGIAQHDARSHVHLAPLPVEPLVSETPAVKQVATVFMGDSVTQGDTPTFNGTPGPLSWVSYTLDDARSPWTYKANVAVAGQTTAQMAARFQQDVLSRHPRGVVILGGTNDIDHGVPLTDSLANIRQMVTAAENAGAKVWVVTPPPWAEHADEVAALRAAERELADGLGATFVDAYPALATDGGGYRRGLTLDGIHPNARGAAVLARGVLRALS